MSDFPETSPEDFKQIHKLQHQNLVGNLSNEEAIEEGFLTLACTESDLRKFSVFSIKPKIMPTSAVQVSPLSEECCWRLSLS